VGLTPAFLFVTKIGHPSIFPKKAFPVEQQSAFRNFAKAAGL
jgi:hypothetical protein